jgi:hypothetical protein
MNAVDAVRLRFIHQTAASSTEDPNEPCQGIMSDGSRCKHKGLHGVYHHASEKHLHRYVDEFTFRLNDGDVKRHTMERLGSLIDASFGPRLTYKELTAA